MGEVGFEHTVVTRVSIPDGRQLIGTQLRQFVIENKACVSLMQGRCDIRDDAVGLAPNEMAQGKRAVSYGRERRQALIGWLLKLSRSPSCMASGDRFTY